ncbi:MAG: phosphate ABC transporter substrate-binding protein [Aquabacterium sp.]|nr:phosphate ABC transporter substrate-binding protein [Aquabacterium sp.]
MQHTLRAAAAVAFLTLAQAASAQVAVIVNPTSPLASMTQEQAAAIFLGKTQTLPSGQTAVPADLPESDKARDIFYSKAAGKSPAQVKATWARLTFSGKATPPKEVPTAADVKKHVAANPDAIGYIVLAPTEN